MRPARLILALAVLALCLALGAGCGDDDGGEEPAPRTQAAPTTPTSPAPSTTPTAPEDRPKTERPEKKEGKEKEDERREGEPERETDDRYEPSRPRGGGRSAPRRATPAPKRVTVTIRDFEYSPRRVTIRRGGSVYWVNRSRSREHTATFKSGPKSPDYSPPASDYIGRMGGTYEDIFKARGTTTYHCTIHPRMTGVVVVK